MVVEDLVADVRVEHFGSALLVVAAVCAVDLDEAVALVEALCAGIGLKRPKAEPARSLLLGDRQQATADAAVPIVDEPRCQQIAADEHQRHRRPANRIGQLRERAAGRGDARRRG
jgi:hypothetical protein